MVSIGSLLIVGRLTPHPHGCAAGGPFPAARGASFAFPSAALTVSALPGFPGPYSVGGEFVPPRLAVFPVVKSAVSLTPIIYRPNCSDAILNAIFSLLLCFYSV